MLKIALLGRDISYTRSPQVHGAIAEALGIGIEFGICDVPFDKLAGAVKRLYSECDGFFVTKPYKNDIKPFLGEVRTQCGVNLVRCSDKVGMNTDKTGFMCALKRAFADTDGIGGALVLGAGGAAYTVAEALKEAGKNVFVLDRTMMNAVKMCRTLGVEMYYNQPCELIVNATSAGLRGEDVLQELCVLPHFKYGFDLIYEPKRTPFIEKLARAGAMTENGEAMLVYQAIEGDRLLTGMDIDADRLFDEVYKILHSKE